MVVYRCLKRCTPHVEFRAAHEKRKGRDRNWLFSSAHLDAPASSLAMSKSLSPENDIKKQVKRLKKLIKQLPDDVPLGTADDRVHQIFTRIPLTEGEEWETFNRRMDNLFRESERDSDGHLKNIYRGPFGMDMVISYLESAVDSKILQWDAAAPKFVRLVTELKRIV